MNSHSPELPSWWTPEEASADAAMLDEREDEFQDPSAVRASRAANEAIRQTLTNPAFTELTQSRHTPVLVREVNGTIREIQQEINPPTDEDKQGDIS